MTNTAYMSFGGGVQSTAIAFLVLERHPQLMAACGGILPDLFIFADTGDEPQALYPHIEGMAGLLRQAGYHFEVVRAPMGTLSAHITRAADQGYSRAEQLPFFVHDAEKYKSAYAIPRRCTKAFKIEPIRRFATFWYGIHRGKPHGGGTVQMWLGLSADEKQRLKQGPVPGQEWATYFQPLAAMNWHRADCINYLAGKTYADGRQVLIARSACVFCPFHSMAEWRAIKANPADWAKAVAVDEALERAHTNGGAFGFKNPLYLNSRGCRLRDLDLSAPAPDDQRSLWDNECAGVCGV